MIKYSVVIPALNSQNTIVDCIKSVLNNRTDIEIIVVDGGSDDQTVQLASALNCLVVHSPNGRGIQLNAGAKIASGDVLLFLHGDTLLSKNALSVLDNYFVNQNANVGTFRLNFNHPHWLLKFYGYFVRMDSVFTSFGDQCIVVRRSMFDRAQGFPAWPLFEDVYFLQILRKTEKIYTFPASVCTSANRFVENGLVRQLIKNIWLMTQYLFGASPQKLYDKYYNYV